MQLLMRHGRPQEEAFPPRLIVLTLRRDHQYQGSRLSRPQPWPSQPRRDERCPLQMVWQSRLRLTTLSLGQQTSWETGRRSDLRAHLQSSGAHSAAWIGQKDHGHPSQGLRWRRRGFRSLSKGQILWLTHLITSHRTASRRGRKEKQRRRRQHQGARTDPQSLRLSPLRECIRLRSGKTLGL